MTNQEEITRQMATDIAAVSAKCDLMLSRQAEQAKDIRNNGDRVGALERFRAWLLGGMALLGVLTAPVFWPVVAEAVEKFL